MQYGIAHLSTVPLRDNPADTSEQTSQVLYGDFFKVLEVRKKWSKIRLAFDKYEGWIDNKILRRRESGDLQCIFTVVRFL